MSTERLTPTELLASLPAGVVVPPPPVKPSWGKTEMGFGFKKPEKPSEQFVQDSFWAGVYGLGAGTVAAWFYDYKKTRMPYFKALSLHGKIVRGPFSVVAAVGVSHAAMNAIWDIKNADGEDRFAKEQTMSQKIISGFVAGSTIGLLKASPSLMCTWGAFFGILSWGYNKYRVEFYPTDKARRQQLYNEKFVSSDEPAPEYLKEENLNSDRMISTFFFEEQVPKKKNTCPVKFEEQ